MMNDLKPCPFCGGEAKLRETNIANMTFYVVYCANKYWQVNPATEHRRMRPDAIEAWNRRTENG